MSKFTPGPWRTEGRYVLALKGKSVCELPRGGVTHAKVDKANANLIATAPEMYEALQAFLQLPHLFDDVCDRGTDCKVCKAILLGMAAIAKAKGRA